MLGVDRHGMNFMLLLQMIEDFVGLGGNHGRGR